MLKFNKILFFILLFSLFTINIYSFSFADTYVVSLPELPNDSSEFEYYYIKKWSDAEYTLYFIDSTDVYISSNNYYFSGKWWSWDYRVTEDINNHVWTNRYGWYNGASHSTLIMPVDGSLDDCNIIYSNFDIKYNDVLLRSKLEMNTEPIESDDTLTLSGIGGFFTDLKNSLFQFFSDLGSKITNFSNNVTSLFSTLFETITSIPGVILSGLQTLFEFLFVPDENLFNYTQELFNEKFGIFNQVRDFVVDLTCIDISDTKPLFAISYKGVEGQLIDFSMYEQYRSFIHGLIIAFSYFFFGKWLINNVPNILGGIYSNSA